MADFIRHTSCPKCGSSDANAKYSDGGSHCWSCGYTVASEEFKKHNALQKGKVHNVRAAPSSERKERMLEVKPSGKPVISPEDADYIKKHYPVKGRGYRSVSDETYSYFGVRHAYDEDDNVIEQYYPVTKEGQLSGYKIRYEPKDFNSKGLVGAECDLFMQHRFNRGGKYIIITEGELDALSAYQMMKEYNDKRGSDFEIAAVSPVIGKNADRQLAAQYKFLDSFTEIILAFDSDKAGREAAESVVKVLPRGKVKIMTMRYKDANEYLQKGKEGQFVIDFYNSKRYTPVGVLGSGELYEKILEQASIPKVPFPPFMNKLNEMLVGGLPLGHIVNIAAGTGLGKTSFITEMVYYWVFNSPHKIGIVSMELDSGQYGETILSRHLSRKLALIQDEESKRKLLKSDQVKEKADELFYTEDGQHRFYLLDNRDGSVDDIQDTIEELVISCGCRIIILDPLQDIIDGLSIDEQAVFMKWCKGIIKSHNVTLILINHVRKAASNSANSSKGDSYSEEEIQGSSTIIKSASANILLSRNKYAEDVIERNTTKVMLSKNRICGITGPAGEIFYENETHTLWDKEKFFSTTTEVPLEDEEKT